MAIYLIVHFYQFGGIITSYLTVEFKDYFNVGSTKCIEIVFFMFFATPYSCILFIVNTTNSDYRDNEESPFWGLIAGIPIPWFVVAILSPIIEDQPDIIFILTYLMFLVLYAYCSYAVMERWMDRFKLKFLPYLNPITWMVIPFLFMYYGIRFKWKFEDIRQHVRRQQREDQQNGNELNINQDEIIISHRSEEILSGLDDIHRIGPVLQTSALSSVFIPSIDRKYIQTKDLEWAIWLCNLKNSKTRLYLNWAHCFHKEWIKTWIEQHRSWPVCRSIIKGYPYESNLNFM